MGLSMGGVSGRALTQICSLVRMTRAARNVVFKCWRWAGKWRAASVGPATRRPSVQGSERGAWPC
jgi:hypothetical protein